MARSAQVAALPWRRVDAGVEVLLVTTRTTRRWVIPKGWTMDGKADHEAAAIEAYEEAGVRGAISPDIFGRYGYLKISEKGNARRVSVAVYALRVERELQDWPERAERDRQWVKSTEAAGLSGEPELVPILQSFADRPPADDHVAPATEKTAWQWLASLFR